VELTWKFNYRKNETLALQTDEEKQTTFNHRSCFQLNVTIATNNYGQDCVHLNNKLFSSIRNNFDFGLKAYTDVFLTVNYTAFTENTMRAFITKCTITAICRKSYKVTKRNSSLLPVSSVARLKNLHASGHKHQHKNSPLGHCLKTFSSILNNLILQVMFKYYCPIYVRINLTVRAIK
jgi:hypothetical protein